MFYNPKRRHGHAGRRSPVQFEQQYLNRLGSVEEIRGDSVGFAEWLTDWSWPGRA
jgi:putative transposase